MVDAFKAIKRNNFLEPVTGGTFEGVDPGFEKVAATTAAFSLYQCGFETLIENLMFSHGLAADTL